MEILIRKPLTKENFWNEMMEKYPNATKAFCDWIDEYKKAVGWGNLFNEGLPDTKGIFSEAPKFHDLPYAMQVGIWLEYVCNRGGCQYEIENFFEFDLRTDIEGFFEHLLEDEAKADNAFYND